VDQEHAEEGAEEEPGQVADTARDTHLVSNRTDDKVSSEQQEVVERGPQHGPHLGILNRNDSLQKTHDFELGIRNEELGIPTLPPMTSAGGWAAFLIPHS
jgi:hypothetical protein